MRRAQGLPLNTIIISIIVVVVLVVIILIFTGNLGNTATTLRSCVAQGGECMSESQCTTDVGRNIGELDCEDEICCVTV
jgi:Sec-independent protein translocase protein TatA